MTAETRARIGVLITVIVWGASFSAIKKVLLLCSPATVIEMRFLIGVAILLPLVFWAKEWRLPRGREWAVIALLGFLSVPFHHMLQSTGLKTAGAAASAWIVSTSPVYVALLGWLFLKERLSFSAVSGIVLASLGVLFVASKGNISGLLSGASFGFGDLLVFISAINWAVFSVLSKRLLSGVSPLWMTTWVLGMGLAFHSLFFLSAGYWHELPALSANAWWLLLFLGVLPTGFGYAFWYEGLRHLPAAQVGAFMYINPVSATIFAAFLLQEAVTMPLAVGASAVAAGVWLVNRK